MCCWPLHLTNNTLSLCQASGYGRFHQSQSKWKQVFTVSVTEASLSIHTSSTDLHINKSSECLLTVLLWLFTSANIKIQCFVIHTWFVLCLYLQRLWSTDQINLTGAYTQNCQAYKKYPSHDFRRLVSDLVCKNVFEYSYWASFSNRPFVY